MDNAKLIEMLTNRVDVLERDNKALREDVDGIKMALLEHALEHTEQELASDRATDGAAEGDVRRCGLCRQVGHQRQICTSKSGAEP